MSTPASTIVHQIARAASKFRAAWAPKESDTMDRKGFTVIELLVALVIIGILLALILPAVQYARESARRAQCASNPHQIGIATAGYVALHGMYPPGGSRQMSLHVFLLPHIEQTALFNRLDFATPDYVDDIEVRTTALPTYFCPSDPAGRARARADAGYGTNYAGNFGTGVQKHGYNGVFQHLHWEPGDSPQRREGPVVPAEIRDGASNTVAISEILCADGSFEKLRVNWMTPGGKRTRPEQLDEFAQICRDLSAPGPQTAGAWSRGRPWTLGTRCTRCTTTC